MKHNTNNNRAKLCELFANGQAAFEALEADKAAP